MTIYVDSAMIPFRFKSGRVGKMSHMVADNVEELMTFAERIGLDLHWFQPLSHPHFDLTLTKRKLALDAGAVLADRRQMATVMRTWKLRIREDMDERDRWRAFAVKYNPQPLT